MKPLSRRTALRGAVAIGAAGVTAGIPIAGPALASDGDPEITRLYREWQALERNDQKLGDAIADMPVSDPDYARLQELDRDSLQKLTDLEGAIVAIPATTLAGVRIKLALAAHWIQRMKVGEGESEERLAISAHRDLEQMAAGGVS